MKEIKNLCRQIVQTVTRIETLSENMVGSADADLVELYKDMRITELEHVQVLALALTGKIAPTDGDANEAPGLSGFGAEPEH